VCGCRSRAEPPVYAAAYAADRQDMGIAIPGCLRPRWEHVHVRNRSHAPTRTLASLLCPCCVRANATRAPPPYAHMRARPRMHSRSAPLPAVPACLRAALQERLGALEAEISAREEEISTLRAQLAGMEGSMREIQEARISKTQAHVSVCTSTRGCADIHGPTAMQAAVHMHAHLP